MEKPYSSKLLLYYLYFMKEYEGLNVRELYKLIKELPEDLTGYNLEEMFDYRHRKICLRDAILKGLDEMEKKLME